MKITTEFAVDYYYSTPRTVGKQAEVLRVEGDFAFFKNGKGEVLEKIRHDGIIYEEDANGEKFVDSVILTIDEEDEEKYEIFLPPSEFEF